MAKKKVFIHDDNAPLAHSSGIAIAKLVELHCQKLTSHPSDLFITYTYTIYLLNIYRFQIMNHIHYYIKIVLKKLRLHMTHDGIITYGTSGRLTGR